MNDGPSGTAGAEMAVVSVNKTKIRKLEEAR